MDLRHDSVASLIRQIALPASLAMLFSVLMNVVDTVYAGMLSATALAALSLRALFFSHVYIRHWHWASDQCFGNELGAQRPERAQRLAFQSMAFATFISVLAAALAYWQLPALFSLSGGEDPYLAPASSYMTIMLIGTTLFSLSMMINSVRNTRGDTLSYRNAQFIGLHANIVLAPLFMFTFGLGVAGPV